MNLNRGNILQLKHGRNLRHYNLYVCSSLKFTGTLIQVFSFTIWVLQPAINPLPIEVGCIYNLSSSQNRNIQKYRNLLHFKGSCPNKIARNPIFYNKWRRCHLLHNWYLKIEITAVGMTKESKIFLGSTVSYSFPTWKGIMLIFSTSLMPSKAVHVWNRLAWSIDLLSSTISDNWK